MSLGLQKSSRNCKKSFSPASEGSPKNSANSVLAVDVVTGWVEVFRLGCSPFSSNPLILTVLNRDYDRGGTVILIKDCQYEGGHPKF